jgi:elongation factor Ts
MKVTVNQIKKLREKTGCGVADCRQALEESGGDLKKAQGILKEKGVAVARKRAGKEANQGLVETYVHNEGKIGVMVEVNCETDFVARTDDFKKFVHELAMQIAAMKPKDVDELLTQTYIRDQEKTIKDLLKETLAKTGENIKIKRFCRYELGK